MLRKRVTTAPKQGRLAPVSHRPAPKATVLLTGFSPFGGETINASWEVARALDTALIDGHTVMAAQLPTEFDTAPEVLADLLEQHHPVLVVCLGQAAGRQAISLERVAINIDDARIPDNAGNQPVDSPVVSGGPPAYFTGLPIKAMLAALREAGIPAEVSQTAGTFVCNHVFYALMHTLDRRRTMHGVRGGFIHVPLLAGQGTPNMDLEPLQRGLRIAIACALATAEDVKLGAGAQH